MPLPVSNPPFAKLFFESGSSARLPFGGTRFFFDTAPAFAALSLRGEIVAVDGRDCK